MSKLLAYLIFPIIIRPPYPVQQEPKKRLIRYTVHANPGTFNETWEHIYSQLKLKTKQP